MVNSDLQKGGALSEDHTLRWAPAAVFRRPRPLDGVEVMKLKDLHFHAPEEEEGHQQLVGKLGPFPVRVVSQSGNSGTA